MNEHRGSLDPASALRRDRDKANVSQYLLRRANHDCEPT
jgi:hypothetical protein